MNIKETTLFEYYRVKAKARKAKQLYKLWKEWCRQFDENYEEIFNKHFKG